MPILNSLIPNFWRIAKVHQNVYAVTWGDFWFCQQTVICRIQKTEVWNTSWHSIYLSAALMLSFWLFHNRVKTTDYAWSIEETVIFVKMTKVENITAAEFYNLQRFATWNVHPWQTLFFFYLGAGLLCSLQPVTFWPSCKLGVTELD